MSDLYSHEIELLRAIIKGRTLEELKNQTMLLVGDEVTYNPPTWEPTYYRRALNLMGSALSHRLRISPDDTGIS